MGTVEPNVLDLDRLEFGDIPQIDFLITNHGLIRADNVGLELPTNHPSLEFEFLREPPSQGLPAMTAFVLPVRVKLRNRQRRSSGGCYSGQLIWTAECNGPKSSSVGVTMTSTGGPCGGTWPDGGGSPNGGRGGFAGNAVATEGKCGDPCKLLEQLGSCINGCVADALGLFCLDDYGPGGLGKQALKTAASCLLGGCPGAIAGAAFCGPGAGAAALCGLQAGLACFGGPVGAAINQAIGFAKCAAGIGAAAGGSGRRRNADGEVAAQGVLRTSQYLVNYQDYWILIFDDILLANATWGSEFMSALDDNSEGGTLLTSSEYNTLLAEYPSGDEEARRIPFLMQKWNQVWDAFRGMY